MLDPSLNIAVFSVPRAETVMNVTMSYYESPPTHYINGIQPVHWVRLVRHVYDVILFTVLFCLNLFIKNHKATQRHQYR